MASALFLAPTDLGETVLATGAVAHLVREGDALTVVCVPEAAALFRAAPGLAQIHTLAADAGVSAPWRVWMQLARTRFDLLIDGRGGFLGRALPAVRRVAPQPGQLLRPLVEDWAEAAGAERALTPVLWIDAAARDAAGLVSPVATPLLILAPAGAARAKRWPWDRYAAVARRLASGPLAGASIAVAGVGARDAETTRAIVSSLEADGVAAIDLGAGLDLLAAAALAERATLCIGNDNALTHVCAAAGAPTLTLFGPTDERVRAPYGPRGKTMRGVGLEQAVALPDLDAGAAMADVTIDAVEAAATELLHGGGLR